MSTNYSSEDKALLKKMGNNIRLLRKKSGISQEELADLAEIDRSYLGSVERGERNVSMINIGKIAKALRLNPSQLLK